jgi:hypothetical protein
VDTPYEYRTAHPAESPVAPPEPLFSVEEAAHEAHLPTAQPRTAFRWLHWLAPVAVGLLLGLLTLTAFGVGLTDWQNPLVWIAPLAGALAMMVWYRALWNASRALSEMYYLFNWGAGQARRIAWLAGIAMLAAMLLPTAILLGAMLLVPTIPSGSMLLPALLAMLLMLPLAVLAVAGGYFHGRQEIVANAVQARVNAERRAQAREARDRSDPRPPTRAEPTDAPRRPIADNSRRLPQRRRTPRPRTTPTAHHRPAGATARRVHRDCQRPRRRSELPARQTRAGGTNSPPSSRSCQRLQPRPIYPDLPPHAHERLRALYQQWRLAYTALLDYVAEAARDCKDGEQIAQRIAAFKDALPR